MQMNLKKIINLSPLVDVLMIVIFWYIMMSNQTMEETKETAKNEMSALQNRYETQLKNVAKETEELTEQLEQMTEVVQALAAERESLSEEAELQKEVNEELSNQLADLREENSALGMLLEQSIGYLYIRLYDGLHENRIIEINCETELVDKFVFSGGEQEYLENRIAKVVGEYAARDEKQRIAVIFLYEGSKARYLDVTQIKNVLYGLKSELGISVHTINMAE